MYQYHGIVGIRVSTGNTTSTAFGTNAVMQSYDWTDEGEETEVTDANTGEIVAWVGKKRKKNATFTYLVGSGTPGTGSAVTAAGFGDMITVTGNDASVTGTKWVVKSSAGNASEDPYEVTCTATLYSGSASWT